MEDHESTDVRVSDAEREQVVGILREQTAAGRLTLQEFEDRLGEVYAARTDRDLQHVLRELPVQPATPARSPDGPAYRRAEERTEAELRQRWRRRLRGEVVGFLMPNFVCNLIYVIGDMHYWWPGWVLVGTGVGFASTVLRGFDPDAERAKLAAEERERAIGEIEMRKLLGR